MNSIIDKDRDDVCQIGSDILSSDRFQKARCTVHHYTTTVAAHSMRVACAALYFARNLNQHGCHINEEDVVECALLHDIGMTDDEVHDSPGFIKCFLHPMRSAEIAAEEYGVSEKTYHAIMNHMWPASFLPPTNLVGWLVLAADKYCSFYEVSHAADNAAEAGI